MESQYFQCSLWMLKIKWELICLHGEQNSTTVLRVSWQPDLPRPSARLPCTAPTCWTNSKLEPQPTAVMASPGTDLCRLCCRLPTGSLTVQEPFNTISKGRCVFPRKCLLATYWCPGSQQEALREPCSQWSRPPIPLCLLIDLGFLSRPGRSSLCHHCLSGRRNGHFIAAWSEFCGWPFGILLQNHPPPLWLPPTFPQFLWNTCLDYREFQKTC